MQIVINIGEHNKNVIDRFVNGEGFEVLPTPIVDDVIRAVRNGTPLPKGHGVIVDLKQVIRVEIEEPNTGKKMVWNNNSKINDTTWRMVTPTIIEADKESKDADSN